MGHVAIALASVFQNDVLYLANRLQDSSTSQLETKKAAAYRKFNQLEELHQQNYHPPADKICQTELAKTMFKCSKWEAAFVYFCQKSLTHCFKS